MVVEEHNLHPNTDGSLGPTVSDGSQSHTAFPVASDDAPSHAVADILKAVRSTASLL